MLVAKQLPKVNLMKPGINAANFTVIYTQTPIKKNPVVPEKRVLGFC